MLPRCTEAGHERATAGIQAEVGGREDCHGHAVSCSCDSPFLSTIRRFGSRRRIVSVPVDIFVPVALTPALSLEGRGSCWPGEMMAMHDCPKINYADVHRFHVQRRSDEPVGFGS